jgi:hypothetical protein
MLNNTESIQQLYLAYLQRPADSAGLAYWTRALENGTSLSTIREQFAKQAEFQAFIAGKSHAQVVDGLYLNLFGAHADKAGLDYYTGMLDQNKVSVDAVVGSIINGAIGSDAEFVYNKVVAAEWFTTLLGVDPINIIGYPQDFSKAKQFLASVTSDTSMYAALGALPDLMEGVATLFKIQGTVIADPLASSTEAAVQQLYLAYLKRPADVVGLNYWSGAVAASSLQAVSQKFAQSKEYLDSIKGLSHEAIVDNVYLNLFGHHADSEGLRFYSVALGSGNATIDQVVLGVVAGAQQQDRELLDNRVIASEMFTTSLNITPLLADAYTSSLDFGKAYLEPVNNDASVYTAVRGLPSVLYKLVEVLSAPVELVGVASSDAAGLA